MLEITEAEITHFHNAMRELVSKIREEHKYTLRLHDARNEVLRTEYSCDTMDDFYVKHCGGIVKASQTIYKRVEP